MSKKYCNIEGLGASSNEKTVSPDNAGNAKDQEDNNVHKNSDCGLAYWNLDSNLA